MLTLAALGPVSISTCCRDFDRASAEAVGSRQARCASLLLAISEPVAEHLRVRHPLAADRVRVVGNGVDAERFPLPPVFGRPTAGRPFSVGFVGALEPLTHDTRSRSLGSGCLTWGDGR